MRKRAHRFAVVVSIALGALIFLGGCQGPVSDALGVDASAQASDLSSFFQDFAREALAAFLF